jgi:sulfite reductase (NADPH) hemoprotein beta-component
MSTSQPPSTVPSAVELIKAASTRLRGTLAESLADPLTGALREPDTHLLKFHGSYQQDDRELRDERRRQKLEPAWRFMVRTRFPGGVLSARQWLALDAIAGTFANGTLRATTRQTIQFHGIVKRELKSTMQALNAALIDTIATCGDVNRNVLAPANPVESVVHAEVHAAARALAEHLLPRSRAYHEIFLDGERVAGAPEVEPLYGDTYLPRKFKAALAIPPRNDVDVFAHDLGFIAIVEQGRLAGFNLVVGGGMGATHGEAATYPRLGDVVGFLPPDQLVAVGEAVLGVQRDHGDRGNRRHARLKYTIDDRGLDWFVAELHRHLAVPLAPARPFRFDASGDRFGWTRGTDGFMHVTLRIPAGRIADTPAGAFRSGLREIAAVHTGPFRLTANQNVIVSGVHPAHRAAVEALIVAHGLDLYARTSAVARDALACVALPTCPLAMAEAERYLGTLTGAIDRLLEARGLGGEPVSVRVTGCPNGCARPYVAEIALVGKAPGRYNLHLGGSPSGDRLNVLHRENIDEPTILAELDAQFAAWGAARDAGERFGDFLWRTGRLPRPAAGRVA